MNTTTQTLAEARRLAADAAFEAYDFGSSFEATDSDSWTIDGIYWSRWVYGDTEEGEDKRGRVSFGVEFAPESAEIVDRWQQA